MVSPVRPHRRRRARRRRRRGRARRARRARPWPTHGATVVRRRPRPQGRPGRDPACSLRRRRDRRGLRRGPGRATVLEQHGRIDVLVNAAGVMLRKAYDETSLAEFEHVVRVNLTGSWLLAREVAPAMTPTPAGSSTSARSTPSASGPIPESAYYASKAGVANVTRALAAELGPRGITVNCLAPGVFYPTRMTAAARRGSRAPAVVLRAHDARPARRSRRPTSPAPSSSWPPAPRRT